MIADMKHERSTTVFARAVATLLVATSLAACVSSSVQRVGSANYAPAPATADVAVFTAESDVKESFEVVGVISYDNPGKYQVLNLGDAIEPLKQKAREVGANGIIIDNSQPVKSGIISTGIYVEARAIRLAMAAPNPTVTSTQSQIVPAPVPEHPLADIPATSICRSALNIQRSDWDTNPGMDYAIHEALRRGLSVEKCQAVLANTPQSPSPDVPASKQQAGSSPGNSIPMKKDGGTYVVPVLINNAITLAFVVDSGAADVSIPADVVLTLIRTGTLADKDFIGTQTYTLADGSTTPSSTFRIRSLKVGDTVVENVIGHVADVRGPLLLGQTFLGRFKSWSIDNAKHALVLE